MKGLIFQGERSLSCQTVPDPSIEKTTDAIVKVEWSAVCGSDLHIYRAHEKGLDEGTIMGHEFVGEIVEVGKDVLNFSIGDSVVSPFTTSCGQCYYCLKGLTCRCIHGQLYGWREGGHGLHGAQAQFVRVPFADSTLLSISSQVDHREILFTGDILSTGFYCAENAEIKPESTVAILGCGPVGLMAIIGAIELGAGRIFAIDSIEERLVAASKYGALPIDYSDENPAELIRSMTDGRGADAVLEVVGSAAAQRSAIEILRPGGILSTVGVHTSDSFAFSPVTAYNKNLTFKIGRCPARHYMEKMSMLVESGKYSFKDIISHQLPLSEGEKGYHIFDQKLENCQKVLLNPNT